MFSRVQKIETAAKENVIIGITCGSFDIIHPGYIMLFKECKNQCDEFIIALQGDPTIDRPEKNKPVQTLEERKQILESIRYIDKVITYNTEDDLYELLQKEKLDVRFIGEDWRDKKYTGHDLPIKIIFNSRSHDYSATKLKNQIADSLKKTDSF